jgi:hypothetical protein
MQEDPAQGRSTHDESKRAESTQDPASKNSHCKEPESPDTDKRVGVYGIPPNQLLDESIVVSAGKHVRLSGLETKSNGAGLVRLQPKTIDDVKRWIGVPDTLGARRKCCAEPAAAVPGVTSAGELRKLDMQERRAVHDLADEYVNGDSRRVASYGPLLNHLVDRAVITGIFLRQDIDIHKGAVLEIGKDVKVLFARHIRIYRGGLLKLTGSTKIDCVTITGDLSSNILVTVDKFPSYAKLLT